MIDCYNSAVQLDGAIDLDLPGAHVRFTGREGERADGPRATFDLDDRGAGDPAAIAANRRRAADGRAVAAASQVHGTRVLVVDAPTGEAPEEADGLATASDALALLVLTADCLPVALATPAAVAIVHAGWRGLAGGVLEQGIRALRSLDPGGRLHAAIGPGAGACCYEVGDEVADRFPAWARHGRRVDLKAVASQRLREAGADKVVDVGRCTMCEAGAFFSHRASGGAPGRQGGLVWRVPCPS